MRKKKIISGVLATAVALSVTVSGCSLISTNASADMNQTVATVNIAKSVDFDKSLEDYKNAVGETSIIKRELVAYFINVGYSYVQSGSSYEEVFNMLLDSLVDNAVVVQYSTMYLLKDKATNEDSALGYDATALQTYMSLDTEVKKYEYLLDGTTDGKGTGDEAKIAKYSLYQSINSAIDNYESNILDEEDSSNGTDSRAVPDGVDTEKENYYPKGEEDKLDYGIYTGYDGYLLKDSGTYEKDKLEGTTKETRMRAYNRFISSLASSSYDLVDKKTENLRDVLSLRYIEDEYVSQLEQRIINKYYDVYEEEREQLLLNADGNYGFVADNYQSLLDLQKEEYASESEFTSAIGSMSDSSFVLYAPEAEEGKYGLVYNILLPFSEAQSDALKELQAIYADDKLDGGYKPDYYSARAKLLERITTTDQRSAWFNGETEYAFNGENVNGIYDNGKNSTWLFFENNVANGDKYEKLDKYAGLYPYNGKVIEREDDYLLAPNKLTIDDMLVEFENYIKQVSGCSLTKGSVNYNTKLYKDEKVDGKDKIDYANFVYAKGKVDFGGTTEAENRANLLIKQDGEESKQYLALSAVNELQYAYTTDVGVLSNYLGYTVEAGDTSYIKEFEYASHEAVNSGAGSYAVCAGDYGWHLIYVTYTFGAGEGDQQYSPVWTKENVEKEGTFENLFYEWVKSRNLSDISSTRRKQVINTYKSDDTVEKYQSRYQNLLDLDK